MAGVEVEVEVEVEMLRPTAALLGAQIAVAAAIERRAVADTAYDATTHDLLLRLALSPHGRLRGVDLCRQLQLSPGYVSRRVDRAESDGLVRRSPDPTDRRAQSIALTDTGRAVLDDFVPRLVEVVNDIVFANLDRDEIETLVDLLTRVEAAAKAAVSDRPAARSE